MLSSRFLVLRPLKVHHFCATPVFALRWSSASSLTKEIESLKQALRTANETLISLKHEANEMKQHIAMLEAVPVRSDEEFMTSLFGDDWKVNPEMTTKVLSR